MFLTVWNCQKWIHTEVQLFCFIDTTSVVLICICSLISW